MAQTARRELPRTRFEFASIKRAAQQVVRGLRNVGVHNAHLYEVSRGSWWRGFCSDIPKEEQVRSEIYRHLTTELASGFGIEVEWAVYNAEEGRAPKSGSEIDLVVFEQQQVRALLEVKRVYRLVGWRSKAFGADLRADVEKLRRMRARLTPDTAKEEVLCGVVVAAFVDTTTAIGQINWGLTSADGERVNLTARPERIAEINAGVASVAEDTNYPTRDIFAQMFMIRV